MASNYPSNPFGEQFPPQAPINPYGSPQYGGKVFEPHALVQAVKGKVWPPAIFLIVISSLGRVLSLFNVVFAMVMDPSQIDPNANDFFKQIQRDNIGLIPMIIQSVLAIVNLIILGGAIQMLRMKMRPLGVAAAILAMLNFGSFCCILGLPGGIWSLVILFQPDVTRAFEINSQRSGN
jgi:hypothetical protein